MRDLGKQNVLGVLVDAVDYEAAAEKIIGAARDGRAFAGSALAVHGVMTGVGDREHRFRLNHFDLVTPDGQPVRWALNLLYGARLGDRVYGPNLALRIYAAAAEQGLPIYLYGSRPEVLDRLVLNLQRRNPGLIVAGAEPSKFRRISLAEKGQIVERIKRSGAKVVLVGLGCPRQEIFVHEYHDALSMPVLAVGAAFDYHAGLVGEPPLLLQRLGLQWLYRLVQQPSRLWKRYLLLNPAYVGLLALQGLKLWRPDPTVEEPPRHQMMYG